MFSCSLVALTSMSIFHCETQRQLRKRWVWRMYSRSGFPSGATCERTLVPVFLPGNIRMYPRSGFRSGGTSAKTTLLENHPFVNLKSSKKSLKIQSLHNHNPNAFDTTRPDHVLEIMQKFEILKRKFPSTDLGCRKWGCNKWGLKWCLAALLGNRPKSADFTLFSAFFALFWRVR